ncbi:F-box protein At5g07610-like [Coffea arabica]|uniref:F-box protein At5g07610-like n=1 Tax=Coffea arabica TaxID=13443 RepID=A0ABM4US19_COFAR
MALDHFQPLFPPSLLWQQQHSCPLFVPQKMAEKPGAQFHLFLRRVYKEDINFTLPSPPASMEHSGIWYFGESGGCMYFIDINNPGEMLFDVFELASGCSEWVLKHHLNLAPLTTLYPSMVDEEFDHSDDWRFRFRLTYFVEDENEKKVRLVISLLGKVILYDINDMVVKELAEVGPTDTDDDCRDNLYQWKDGYPVMKTLTYV